MHQSENKTQINHYDKQRQRLLTQSMHQSENKTQINHYDKQRRVLMAILLCARVNENQ